MRSYSIRNISDETYERIRTAARERGTSINRVIVRLLENTFRPEKSTEHHDLDDLFGTWTHEEFEEFSNALSEQRKLDPELWK